MKQLYSIVATMLLCHTLAFAQIPNCDALIPYPQFAYEKLRNLDKSQVSTGVLYDYAFPLEDVENYDGTLNTDTTDYARFIQSYHRLYLSTFNRVNIAHISDYEQAVHDFHPDREFHHPIGFIDYQFNAIDPDAFNNNLLSISNQQIFDVPNRTQSPYFTKTTQMATMMFDRGNDCVKAGVHYFHFSPNFVLTNTSFSLNDIQAIEIKVNGVIKFNGTVNGLNNEVIPITIINADRDLFITMTITIPTGTKIYQFSICQLTQVYTSCDGEDEITVTGFPFDGGYNEGSYSATAKANIYYANGNCNAKRITKPIIFVDGFDPGNKQHAADIWENYLNKKFVENNIDSYLGDSLRAKGFDIIIFDPIANNDDENYYRGGVGYIENNGLVLAKFLQDFYAQHSSTMTQDFIVVGASMGGLISRFGLAWMEKNNMPHHTSLFISFDCPQAGAQIPIGLQQMVDNFTQSGILKKKKSIKRSLHQTNAATQLLLWLSSTNSETMQAHPHRQIFLNNLAAVGNYPKQCRNIAIVDGNRGGILKTFSPDPTTITAINERDKILDVGIKNRLFPDCNQPNCFKVHAEVFAQTSSVRHPTQIFELNSGSLLLSLFSGSWPYSTSIKYGQAENGNQSIDIAPGSRIRKDPLAMLKPWMEDIAWAMFGRVRIPTNSIKFSNFVPTISAVDYTFPNNETYNLYKNFTGVNLSKCAGTTPFDTVYAPISYDLDHVDIDAYIASVFRSEVYFPKAKSVCADPNCPPYLTLNSAIPNSERILKKAQKAIFIEEGFKADGANEAVVFKAAIGCEQILSVNQKPKKIQSFVPPCVQPFEFDQSRNFKTCENGFTTFRVFVRNIDISTYAEFSTDGVNWAKANITDNGWEVTLPNNTQAQYFQARTALDRNINISGYLDYCN